MCYSKHQVAGKLKRPHHGYSKVPYHCKQGWLSVFLSPDLISETDLSKCLSLVPFLEQSKWLTKWNRHTDHKQFQTILEESSFSVTLLQDLSPQKCQGEQLVRTQVLLFLCASCVYLPEDTRSCRQTGDSPKYSYRCNFSLTGKGFL